MSLQKRIEELQSSLAGEQTGRNQAASKISALEQQLQAMSLSKVANFVFIFRMSM